MLINALMYPSFHNFVFTASSIYRVYIIYILHNSNVISYVFNTVRRKTQGRKGKKVMVFTNTNKIFNMKLSPIFDSEKEGN